MRLLASVVLAVGLADSHALAQTTSTASGSTAQVRGAAADGGAASSTPAGAEEADEGGWEFALSALAYLIPDSRDYVQPTVMADHRRLHLEARHSYEDRDTGSVWIGCNFAAGEKVTLEVTPMLGGVFGNTTGVAPGYRGSLSWRKLELCGEGEYLIDTDDTSASFFYSWSELTLAPAAWLRFGAVVDRTKLYKTEFEIQRGFLLGISYRRVDFTTYVFNPDASPTVVLGLGLSL